MFTKLDLQNGYNNVRIREGDQWKGTFMVKHGNQDKLIEPTVMFFEMCNAPATFQHMMNDGFQDMLAKGWIMIYMDDILIFSDDAKVHQDWT